MVLMAAMVVVVCALSDSLHSPRPPLGSLSGLAPPRRGSNLHQRLMI